MTGTNAGCDTTGQDFMCMKGKKYPQKTIFQSLQDAGIEYDELHFGKPWAQFYIDDCGVNAYADLEKELGYYPPTSAAVASKYVPSPVASTPPSVVGRARHSSTTVALAAALGVAVGVLAARK